MPPCEHKDEAMESNEVKTPSELAEEARQIGRDAATAVQPQLNDAKKLAGDTAESGRAYAKDAANTALETARNKAQDLKAQWDQAGESCARYIAEKPMQSVLFSAAGGALLTTLLMAAMRTGRRYYS